VTATTVEEMTGWVDTSMRTGAWLVLVIHGVEGVGYQPLPAANVKALFDDIKTKSDRVWVATYQDGAKYIRERMKAVIKTVQAGQAIEVTVAHPLDANVYEVPLTARTTVPAEWTAVQVTQGQNTTKATAQKGDGRSYVQYHVNPNAGVVRLAKAQ
jgi:hypothetical protein